jgi:very-short-patch-repair endonuclease
MTARRPRAPSSLEEALALQVRAYGLPAPVREYRFHPDRRYRADFAWPDAMLLVECEGFTAGPRGQAGGRHATLSGIRADCAKYNAAAEQGWTVLRYEREAIRCGEAVRQIERMLRARGACCDPRPGVF